DASRKLAQLVERRAQLVVGLVEEVSGAVRVRPEACARELEREPEGKEPLLRAVVQVALEPAPFFVARRGDARAGAPKLPQLRARERGSSTSCARSSAWRRSFSSASRAAAAAAVRSALRSSRTGSCTSAATGASAVPSTVTARSEPDAGRTNGRPSASTYDRL